MTNDVLEKTLTVGYESKKKPTPGKSASPQMDLFADSKDLYSKLWKQIADNELATSEAKEILGSILISYNSDEDISSKEISKYLSRIDAVVKDIDRERDVFCKRVELKRQSPFFDFHILPAKSPRDHLARANVTFDDRAKDWVKVSSDLKRAYFNALSDSIRAGLFRNAPTRAARKYAG